jgi:putative sigma-54 modulation protein
MLIQITARHLDVPESLRSFIESRLEKLERYIDGITDIHVVLSSEKYRHIAELNVHSRGNVYLSATENSEDLKVAVTQAIEKIEGQAKKQHDKRIHRKRRRAARMDHEGVFNVISADRGTAQRPAAPHVIESQRFVVKPLSVEEAILQIEEEGGEFLVFRNASNERTNVLYRRPDGNFGLIDPQS